MSKREIAEVCAQLGRRQVLKAFAGAVGGVALTAYGGHSAAAGSAGASSPSSAPNELVISLPSGSQTNYPLQFGRAFAKGAVPGLPAVALDGVPLALQQVDVKTLHDDCSVKFAVISVVIPWLDTRERVLSITNKAVTPAPAAETLANMLAKYDFDARIGLEVGGRPLAGAPISARSMLSALTDVRLAAETAVPGGGVNSRYWTVGPVCTTVLLCDHTTKAYDVGTNTTKAIRPMFHVQFWPSLKRYHVRHIIEVADVSKLKNEDLSKVVFTIGQASPVTKLDQSGVILPLATWHSRSYWAGEAVPRANVKHGVAYLANTMAMPNYDTRVKLNVAALASYKTDFASKPKALSDPGYWVKTMPAAGGRSDLGLMPKWDVLAMYSGAAHMHEISEAQAEFAGSWAMYFREGSDSKNIFGDIPGKGRIISKVSRPNQFMYDGNGNMVKKGVDGFTVDGLDNSTRGGWAHDSAHTPGMFWFNYLTTGSAFWQEKVIQLGAWGQFLTNPGLSYNSVGNGRSSSDAILNGVQPRGWGWQIRNRARAWWATLDGSPERLLMNKTVMDAVAQKAGLYDIPGFMVGNPIRDAWNTNHAQWAPNTKLRPNPLNYWEAKGGYNGAGFVEAWGALPLNSGLSAQAGWMRDYITMCTYVAVELGFENIRPMAEWAALQTNALAGGPRPNFIDQYTFPDMRADASYYQSLDELFTGWAFRGNLVLAPNGGLPGTSGSPGTHHVTSERYSSIAATAIAMSKGSPGFEAAWAFVDPLVEKAAFYDHDPRYAIVPRT